MKIVSVLIAIVMMVSMPEIVMAKDSYEESINYVTCVGEITDTWNMTPVKIDDSNLSYSRYGYEVTMFDNLDGQTYAFWMMPTDNIREAVRHSLKDHDLVSVKFSTENVDDPCAYVIEDIDVVGTTLYGGITYKNGGYAPFGLIQQ